MLLIGVIFITIGLGMMFFSLSLWLNMSVGPEEYINDKKIERIFTTIFFSFKWGIIFLIIGIVFSIITQSRDNKFFIEQKQEYNIEETE